MAFNCHCIVHIRILWQLWYTSDSLFKVPFVLNVNKSSKHYHLLHSAVWWSDMLFIPHWEYVLMGNLSFKYTYMMRFFSDCSCFLGYYAWKSSGYKICLNGSIKFKCVSTGQKFGVNHIRQSMEYVHDFFN